MADRFSSSRLEAFSDGVFSIAATLLVLEIAVPEGGFDDLWQAIGDQWPSYLAYTTSFFTIGALWTAHHGLFRRLESADARMLHLNLLLLWVVAFLPFPTKPAAEALRHESEDPERAAVLFYGGVLLVISIVMTAMTQYALRRRELLREAWRQRSCASSPSAYVRPLPSTASSCCSRSWRHGSRSGCSSGWLWRA
jgi:uncharacterized membrane protein